MARTVKICVVDSEGYGLVGQRVKAYGGSDVKTDREGRATLTRDGLKTIIYVNDFTAYDGYVNNRDSVATATKSGGKV